MRKLNGIELFAGSGKLSSSFKSRGHNFISVDIRKRKNKCMPDIRADIMELSIQDLYNVLGSQKVDIVFCGLPCDIWSYASGGKHLDKNYQALTEKAKKHLALYEKTIQIINELKPKYFFIENPRGKLRGYPPFIQWLSENNGITKTLTMSSYGFPTTKPTNIFTNCCTLFFKELDKFGRGAKCNQAFDNLTKCQRQSYPVLFCEEIVNFVEKYPYT